MIKTDNKVQIVIEVNGTSYDLSASEEYSSFLLWVTSPRSDVSIGAEAFQVADDLAESERDKAERYAEFLADFASRREEKLVELNESHSAEEREAGVKLFIERLNQKDS